MTESGSLPLLACEGAPRDMGLAQGRAFEAEIAERVRRVGGRGDWLGRWRPFEGPRGHGRAQRTARDVRRHFPHLDERVIGLSRGADVSELGLHYLLARERTPEGVGATLRVGLGPDGRITLASPEEPGLLRRAEPDAYIPSVEWTLPWLPGAYAGVNAGGLACAARSPGRTEPDACEGPAFLLLQNCLHQFDSVDGAAEWCESRPSGGHAELLFCDAAGRRAAITIEGDKRTRSEPQPLAADGSATVTLDPAAKTLEAPGHRIVLG